MERWAGSLLTSNFSVFRAFGTGGTSMNFNQREGEGREVQESFDALETKLRGQYRE